MKPQYTQDDLDMALQAIAGGKSVRKAALEWGIPRSTLQDRVHGTETHHEAAEDQQRLSPAQEKRLADWILCQEELGLPLTHSQIKEFVVRILAVKGDTNKLGKNWVTGFRKRNPQISTKRTRLIDSKRINGATSEVITAWFSLLDRPTFRDIKPEHRYNMDEAGIMEGMGSNGLVLGRVGRRVTQKKTPGAKAWTSFIECISATGVALPPIVIFKGKTIQQQWYPEDMKPFRDWLFRSTENGWTSDEVAIRWLEKVFLPRTATKDQEKRLLIFDGHGSHETNDFMFRCYQNNVQLMYLPAHTSHVLQPLDLSIFSPLKRAYRRYIGYLNYLTNSSLISKRRFLKYY